MITKNQIEALAWKYPNGHITTRNFVITEWIVDGVELPTESEILTIEGEYNAREVEKTKHG